MSAKSIYGWLHQARGEAVISVPQYKKLKRENEELKRLIGELMSLSLSVVRIMAK